MVKKIKFEFCEPYTGCDMQGEMLLYFRNEKDLNKTLERYQTVLSQKYDCVNVFALDNKEAG